MLESVGLLHHGVKDPPAATARTAVSQHGQHGEGKHQRSNGYLIACTCIAAWAARKASHASRNSRKAR